MSVVVPIRDLTTREILYGARTTSHRYELLTHDHTTGVDSLIGYLDGVTPGGKLTWSAAKSVKKDGNLTVVDLDTAQEGTLRIRDINLLTTRVRPVKVIEGLPEMPLGIYEMSATPESWSDTGRTYSVELLDKSTVLVQDEISETFVAEAGVPILTIVKDLIESAGELISIDASETGALANARVWEVGTSKLRIINDLLTVLNYNALWVDGPGNFRATPYVRPAARSIRYTVLNDESGQRLVRELVDGEEAIYSPDWTRDQDLYGIPNRVIAVQSGTGDDEPLTGIADNTDPLDRFSIPNRGIRARTLTNVDVPDGTSGEIEAALEAVAHRTLIAASSPQSVAEVTSLPIPLELLDAVRFANAPAGIDGRFTVQSVEIGLAFDSMMRLSLLRVVDV